MSIIQEDSLLNHMNGWMTYFDEKMGVASWAIQQVRVRNNLYLPHATKSSLMFSAVWSLGLTSHQGWILESFCDDIAWWIPTNAAITNIG